MAELSILSRRNRWEEFKQQYVCLISEALLLLREKNTLINDEWVLNRLLYQCIVEANFNLGLDFLPSPEAKNPPHPDDPSKVPGENNIPDFSWPLMDPTATYPHWNRNFSLESKRLGTDKSRNLMQEYVSKGILRFFLEEEGYGKGCEAGAMAAYIIDMELDTLLDKVNSYIAKHASSIPSLGQPGDGWRVNEVNAFSHSFQRNFVPITFLLTHFWLDMRDCVFLSPEVPDTNASSLAQDLQVQEEADQVNGKKPGKRRKELPTKRKKNLTSKKIRQELLPGIDE